MMRTNRMLAMGVVMLIGLAGLSGCLWSDRPWSGATGSSVPSAAAVPVGTPLTVRLATRVSSETARVGDPWTGSVVNSVTIGSQEVIHAGSSVRGVVTAVHVAERGAHAILDLVVLGVDIDGRPRDVTAITEPVIAGTRRARDLAASPEAAAAAGTPRDGAGREAASGVPGGMAGAWVVVLAKGEPVVLQPGSVMMFTVSEPFVPRRG